MEPEVRETLSRHGLSDADIERMAEFEASQRKPRKRTRVVQPTLFETRE